VNSATTPLALSDTRMGSRLLADVLPWADSRSPPTTVASRKSTSASLLALPSGSPAEPDRSGKVL